jgi:acyl dehydratase
MNVTDGQEVPNYITEEAKAQIGKEGLPATWPEPVERSTLRRYVDATEDHNPLFRDERVAKRSRFGGLMMPPFWLATLTTAFGQRLDEVLKVDRTKGPVPGTAPRAQVETPGLDRFANAGSEIEWFRPVYVGDTITFKSRVGDISQRTGRTGPLVITTTETEFRNQHGELIAIMKGSGIRFR